MRKPLGMKLRSLYTQPPSELPASYQQATSSYQRTTSGWALVGKSLVSAGTRWYSLVLAGGIRWYSLVLAGSGTKHVYIFLIFQQLNT